MNKLGKITITIEDIESVRKHIKRKSDESQSVDFELHLLETIKIIQGLTELKSTDVRLDDELK